MSANTIELIHTHFKRSIDAMQLLHRDGFLEATLSLWYVTIDQLAWLSVAPYHTTGKVFKAWVDDYLLPRNRIACSSSELWGARNGWLHMGTAESQDSRQKDVDCIYYWSVNPPRDCEPNVKYLEVEQMLFALLEALLFFMEKLEQDSTQLAIAHEKARKKLRWTAT